MPPAWVADYIGLPYEPGASGDAVDCWGLYARVLREQAGVEVPAYDGPLWLGKASTGQNLASAALLHAQRFQPVPAGQERLFDGALFAIRGFPIHVGVVIEPGWMLHSQTGADSVYERYRDAMMWERRIAGFYRHV